MPTVTLTAGSGADDADQRADLSAFNATAGTAYGASGATATDVSAIGLRFPNCPWPKNARITAAQLEVYVNGTKNDDAAFVIYAENVSNAADYVTDARVWGRSTTAGGVPWYATDLGVGWRSPADLASLVSAVTFRSGWVAGNALGVLLHGSTGAAAALIIDTYENADAGVGVRSPRLHVTYETNPLPAPVVTFTRDSGTQATVAWGAITEAADYVVVVERFVSGAWAAHASTVTASLSAVFAGLDATLNYRARAIARP